MPDFTIESTAPRPPREVFDFVCDTSKWPLFRGWGPLPAILEATVDGPVRLGSRIRVRNSDGSVHHEVIVEFDPGRRYAIRMELAPPVSWVMGGIEEIVDFEAAEGGTRLRRRFIVRPRNWLVAPVAWLFGGVFLPRAVAAHNDAVAKALA